MDSTHHTDIAGRYIVEEELGEGSYGKVFRVRDIKADPENESKALKEISMGNAKADSKSWELTLAEAKLQRKLNHPNIVRVFDSFLRDRVFHIVTEYCEGGDLDEKIQEYKSKGAFISEEQIMAWLIQLLLALRHIHKSGILHRDIKTRNIFLRRNMIKIGDFGISRVLMGTSELAFTCIGTPYYMSPEAISYSGYNDKSDIWSLGCVLYELAGQKPAFEGCTMFQVFLKIEHSQLPNWPKKYSKELHQFYLSTMEKDPRHRPSANDLLRTPFIQQHKQSLTMSLTTALSGPGAPRNKNIGKRPDNHKRGRADAGGVPDDILGLVVPDDANDRHNILHSILSADDDTGDDDTLKEDAMQGAFQQQALTSKLSIAKTKAEGRIGRVQFHKAYLWLKNARSPNAGQRYSEEEITRQFRKMVPSNEDADLMDQIAFMETQQREPPGK